MMKSNMVDQSQILVSDLRMTRLVKDFGKR